MHNLLSEQAIMCPYCGETISVLVDASAADHDYIEDCQVCCSPIKLEISVGEGHHIGVIAKHENEV